jgi:hypothetical protein
MIMTETFADAVKDRTSAAVAARATARGRRLERGERATFMSPSHWVVDALFLLLFARKSRRRAPTGNLGSWGRMRR